MTLRELDDLVDEMLRGGRPTVNQIVHLDSVNWESKYMLAVLKKHPAPLSLARRLARLGDFLFEHGLEDPEVAWEACEGIIMWFGEYRPELDDAAYELGEQLNCRDVEDSTWVEHALRA